MSKLRGHIQCACNTHLLEELGHAPAVKILYTLRSLLRPFLAINIILSVLPVYLLHVHIKVIAHANNWSLTLAFHIIFIWASVNFMWAQARVCPGVATPLFTTNTRVERPYSKMVYSSNEKKKIVIIS